MGTRDSGRRNRDAPPDEGLPLLDRFLGIEEGRLDEIPRRGWSAAYVRRETTRALAAVAGAGPTTALLPGIEVDIPTGEGLKQTTPEDVYAAVTAALEAGAQGVVLSRKYAEMWLANVAACGRALADLDRRGSAPPGE